VDSVAAAHALWVLSDAAPWFSADDALADRIRSSLAHGRGHHAYDHRYVGINGRLDTI
jgi:hypothetical protein